ncbi:MAG TPA: hypothetical protein O0X34_00130 [Methanocorpusculum sp.]|nr:hypothetical protein [Methanocorpusculum sp.]HJK70031.1 hypothetical protein [Methanocorpusculum sp.]HJK73394.1 hypothetical protein [Methanocorpusculum sp.]
MKHLKKRFTAAIILIAFTGSANAAVVEQQVSFEILTDDQVMSSWAAPVNGDVRQGETDRHAYTPMNGQHLEVSLTWDRAASGNDLDLYIYPPDSNSIKIHDNTDGKFDGKISLRTVISTDDLNQLWIFGVTGDQVSGTQSSTLTINSY